MYYLLPIVWVGCTYIWLSLSSRVEALSSIRSIQGVPVQKAKLLQDSPSSPFCYSVSSISSLSPTSNFLATQVWPSARMASFEVKKHVSATWSVCEFGCGPGLPGLTAATCGCSVLATDLDEFALKLVQKASNEQSLNVQTQKFDLIKDTYDDKQVAIQTVLERLGGKVDLILFSDVFENSHVARGAADLTKFFLDRGSRVWTFAQSDRAQRETYVEKLNEILRPDDDNLLYFSDAPYKPNELLWLCDLDETKVVYG